MKTAKQSIDLEYKGTKKRLNLRTALISLCMFAFVGTSAQTGTVTVKLRNASVKELFSAIEKQTSYRFSYRDAEIKGKGNVTISATNRELKQLLEGELSKLGLKYAVSGNKIIVTPVAAAASAQPKKVTGKVVDANGEPVIGATIKEQGTANGTITDFDGNFTLDVADNAILEVSYIGYKSQELQAVAGKTLSVTLREDTEVLDEVVVVGFGTQKKVNLTGSVSTVDASNFESRPVSTATQALQGVVPGLQISTNTGEMDQNMSINIRGIGTIGDGSSGSPLVLIDGMEGDINTINPQDIENISVLKDAAAASIYGSRAPFGVILITTKRGKQGKASVSYNNSLRMASPVNLPEMMDSYTFANFFNSASLNNGGGLIFAEETMQKMLDYQAGLISGGVPASSNGQWGKPDYDPYTYAYANTDWYKEIYKNNVFSHEHNVSVNGGADKISYYASFNYLDQNGLLRYGHDGVERYSATAKLNTTLTDWLKFNFTTRFIRKENERPTALNSWFYECFDRNTWPNLPVYDPNGYFTNNGATNTAMVLDGGGNRNTTSDQHFYQTSLLIEPIKGWVTNIDFNYSILDRKVKETSLPTYNHDVDGNEINTNDTSSLYQENQKEDYWNLNIYSTYEHSFHDAHNLKVMAGLQIEEMKQDFSSVLKNGLMVNNMPQFDLTTGTDGKGNELTPTIRGYHNEWATTGFFGRINYDYLGRYLAEFNLRYDGTSRFRRGNRWQTSPSFSMGWNIANETFWQPIANIVNTLKVRFSYGELGNQNTNSWYPTYRTMNLGAYDGAWLENLKKPNTALVGDLVSTSLTWETVRTWNAALDFGLFNNRLVGSFEFYTRYTDNMVGPAPELPYILGIAVPKTNNCDLKTVGWDLNINWRDKLDNGLGYSIGLTLSDAKTIIESYPGNSSQSIDTYIAGREIGEIWGFETVGIAKTDTEMQEHLNRVGGQEALGFNWAAGDIMYKDLDGNPGITEGGRTLEDHGDLKVIGNETPRYFFGIDLSADWKGWDVRCFFQGVMKRDYWCTGGTFWGIYTGQWFSIGLKEHNDYFRSEAIGLSGHEIPANVDSYYPRPVMDNGIKNQKVQTRYLQDASYIRLKNLQVGYSLPQRWIQKIGLNKCRLYVSGENIWTGTALSGLYDPETISGGFEERGNAYPLSRTWSFGVNLTF